MTIILRCISKKHSLQAIYFKCKTFIIGLCKIARQQSILKYLGLFSYLSEPEQCNVKEHSYLGSLALFRLFPSASLLVAHLGLNPVRVS